ncbi:MAG: DUF3352 domain-containing protein [Planctomycetota bacterium]
MKRILPAILSLLALVALLGVQPPATLAQDHNTTPRKPLPYIVPEGTLLFATLPDVRGARTQLKTWEFKKLLDLPEMAKFIKPMTDQIEAQLAEMESQLKGSIGMGREQVLDLFAGQVSLAVIDADMKTLQELRQGPPSPEQMKGLKLLLVIDVDRTTETFGSAFSYFTKELAREATFEVINHNGVEITRVKPTPRTEAPRKPQDGDGEGDGEGDDDNNGAPPPQPAAREAQGFCYCLFNQALLVTLNDGEMRSTLDLYRNALPDGSLGATKKYRKVRSNLPVRGELGFVYADIQAIVAKSRETIADEEQRKNFDKGYDISGFSGLQAMGANAVLDNGVLRDNLFLYAPGLRKGVMQVLSLPPTDFATLRLAPKDALSYQSLNFDAELLWVEILEAVRAGQPEAYMELQESVKRQAEDGFDLNNDLFGAVGGEMAAWTWRDADDKQQSAVWVSLKSATNFTRFLKASVKLAQSDEGGQMQIDTINIGGSTVYVIPIPERDAVPPPPGMGQMGGMAPFIEEALKSFQQRNMPKQLYVGVVRDALLVTSSQAEFTFHVQNPAGREESLAQNESFQKARQQGFANPSLFYWADLPRMIEPLHALGKEIVEGYRAEKKTNPEAVADIPLDFDHYPARDDVKALFASGAVGEARNNLDGLLVRTRGLGVAGLVASVAATTGATMRRMGGRRGPGAGGNVPPPGMPPMVVPVDPQGDHNEEAAPATNEGGNDE